MIPEITLDNVSEKLSTLTFIFPSSEVPYDSFKDEESIKFVYDKFTDFLKKIYSV